jgi:hypothetical protein
MSFPKLFKPLQSAGRHQDVAVHSDCGGLRAGLYVSCLSRVLDVREGDAKTIQWLAMICLGCLQVTRVLPLRDRALVLPRGDVTLLRSGNLPPALASSVSEFEESLFAALTRLIQALSAAGVTGTLVVRGEECGVRGEGLCLDRKQLCALRMSDSRGLDLDTNA